MGYGAGGQQTQEGAERSQREYEATQARLAAVMTACRYCKAARTRARASGDNDEGVKRAGCREHRLRRSLNYTCSPVSEAYWSS